MVVNDPNVYFEQFSGKDERTYSEDVDFNKAVDPYVSYPQTIQISNKVFKSQFTISNGWGGIFKFSNCQFENFFLGDELDIHSLEFENCSFGNFEANFVGTVKIIRISLAKKIKNISFQGPGHIGKLSMSSCLDVGFLSLYSSVQEFSFSNETYLEKTDENGDEIGDFVLNPDQRIESLILGQRKPEKIRLSFLIISMLRIWSKDEDLNLELEESRISSLGIIGARGIFGSVFDITGVVPGIGTKLYLTNSDLSNLSFHNCNFGSSGRMINANLDKCVTVGSFWPLRLSGSHLENQFGYRQLKHLHQNLGDYRVQSYYHRLEMSSFHLGEKGYLLKGRKNINGFKSGSNWLVSLVEYLVKVSLPYRVSRFGLETWRPILWFLGVLIFVVNSFILLQGEELGLKYVMSWPWQWDFNLFAHILLPTHKGSYHGVFLLEWVDVSWKIISSYLIYHIIVSSRRLTKS